MVQTRPKCAKLGSEQHKQGTSVQNQVQNSADYRHEVVVNFGTYQFKVHVDTSVQNLVREQPNFGTSGQNYLTVAQLGKIAQIQLEISSISAEVYIINYVIAQSQQYCSQSQNSTILAQVVRISYIIAQSCHKWSELVT